MQVELLAYRHSHRVIQGLRDPWEVRPKGELVDDMTQVHHCCDGQG